MANKHMKKYSISFITGEKQIKATLKYYYISTRMVKIKKIIFNLCKMKNLTRLPLKKDNTKCSQKNGATIPSKHS